MNRLFLLALAVSTTSLADDPFACVDPDLAAAFLGRWSESPAIYSTSVPDNFAEINVPTGLILVGSKVGDTRASVVYKTEMDTDAVLSRAVSAMTETGWTEIADQQRSAMGGFQTSLRPKSITLCSNDKSDALSIFTNRRSGTTYVSYSIYAQSHSRICNESMPEARMSHHNALMGRLPVLKLPEDAKLSNAGGGGSGDEVNTRVDVLTAMSRAELLSFLGDQIQVQQWTFDTNWSGEMSAGSSWTLGTQDVGMLIGTLQIFGPSVGAVRIRFSVSLAEPTVGGQYGSWSNISVGSN